MCRRIDEREIEPNWNDVDRSTPDHIVDHALADKISRAFECNGGPRLLIAGAKIGGVAALDFFVASDR